VDRFTRKDAEKALQDLCALLGKRVAKEWNDVGAWRLDYNPTYGGFVVEQIDDEHGSISRPLGDTRVSAREFWERVHFTWRALRAKEQNPDA